MDKIRASSKDSKKTYMMGAKTVGQIQVIVASMKQAQDAVETDTGVADLQELAEKLKANIAELVAIFEHAAQHRLQTVTTRFPGLKLTDEARLRLRHLHIWVKKASNTKIPARNTRTSSSS